MIFGRIIIIIIIYCVANCQVSKKEGGWRYRFGGVLFVSQLRDERLQAASSSAESGCIVGPVHR